VLRKNLESPDAMRPIDFEVVTVNGKDAAQTLTLRDAHQCRICKTHPQIAILPHQLAHTGTVFESEVSERESVCIDQIPQCALVSGVVAQKVHL
jgi:hypothetical protein